MSEHFLKKTKLENDQPVSVQNVPVVEQYEALKATLSAGAGADVAKIFAEPFINWGNDVSAITVSWYCDFAGTAQRLSSVEGDHRAEVEKRLIDALGRVQALVADPQNSKLVAGALSITSMDDIMVVGNQPVIINWGMRSARSSSSQVAQNEHFAGTLGKFLPLAAAPVLYATDMLSAPPSTGSGETVSADAQSASADISPPAAGATGGGAVPSGQDRSSEPSDTPRPPDRRTPIWPVATLAAVLALVALWLLLPGTRLFPSDGSTALHALDDSSIELVRKLNEDLVERERVLQAALEGAVCTPDGSLILPDGRLPDGLLPPPADAEASPTETGRGDVIREGRSDAVIPPDPSRISVPDAPRPEGIFADDSSERDGTAPGQQNLVEVIEERTVLVISQNGEGIGVGTGFFIAPDIVATNHHVIKNAISGGNVFVSNTALSKLHPTNIITADGPFEETLADFAILRVPDVSAPYFRLAAEDGSLKLQNVIAAGYPTDIMESDYRFRQLMDGVSEAVPDLIFTDGVVNTEQAVSETRSLLVHSAPISKGNSGGPLVDNCGRVVGMNTFVREETFRNLNIAQSNRNFIEFLGSAGVTPETETSPCVPQVMRVSVPRETPSEVPTEESAAPSADAPPIPVEQPKTDEAESASPRSAPVESEADETMSEPETADTDPDTALEKPGPTGSSESGDESPAEETALEREEKVELDLGEPLEPGLLDTRSVAPEALE